jgi:hypothetical protein
MRKASSKYYIPNCSFSLERQRVSVDSAHTLADQGGHSLSEIAGGRRLTSQGKMAWA